METNVAIFEKPNILDVLTSEGIDLKKKGRYFWALCPLSGHTEKIPSFSVDPERQVWRCWGCGEYGDVITFIEKYRRLGFKETLTYLGIAKGYQGYKPDPRRIKKRKLTQEYRQCLEEYARGLCFLVRMTWRIKRRLETMEEVEAWSWLYHQEPVWNCHLDILAGDDEREKFELYKEVKYGQGEI